MMDKVSANQALESAILWAFIELLQEVKKGNNNLDNLIMREIKGLHHNTTKADMPEHLKKALNEVVRSSMGHIRSKGYVLAPTEK